MMPAERRVAFRVDASVSMGTGHLTRCLTLADALRELGFVTTFLLGSQSSAWAGSVTARGHAVLVLEPSHHQNEPELLAVTADCWLPGGWQADAASTATALNAVSPEWLVVDHYGIDAGWERAVRSHVGRILVIDDMANRPHDCDVLLDQNLQDERGSRYNALVPPACRHLIGPRYALLRPQFRQHRRPQRRLESQRPRLAVFFGGTDAVGATVWALDAIGKADLAACDVHVVAGSQNPHLDAIQKAIRAFPRANLHIDLKDMAALLASADVGLGAAGVAALERCCVGLPTIAVATAENQVRGLQALADAGACAMVQGRDATDATSQMTAALERLMASSAEREAMSRAGRALTQGHGAGFVSAMMLGRTASAVTVRRADGGDLELVFAWRNAGANRAASLQTDEISLTAHTQWYEDRIQRPTCVFLIAERHGTPVGVVRFDFEASKATVSIMVEPALHGLGLGPQILAAGLTALGSRGDVVTMVAEVKQDNAASLRLFSQAGFQRAQPSETTVVRLERPPVAGVVSHVACNPPLSHAPSRPATIESNTP